MVAMRAAAAELGLATLTAALAACEGGGPAPAAGNGRGAPAPPARKIQKWSCIAAADVARGELLGLACAACHRFRAAEGTLIGPHLQGVFGRPAATVEGFNYSPALKQSGLVWTPKSLEAWLADPAGFVPGTTMAFTGYRSREDRQALIAYLLHATQ